MQLITEEEANKIPVKISSKGTHMQGANYVLWDTVSKMKVGEILLLQNEDWHGKSKPSTALQTRRTVVNVGRFSVKTLNDNSGWLIKKVEEPSKK